LEATGCASGCLKLSRIAGVIKYREARQNPVNNPSVNPNVYCGYFIFPPVPLLV
jgi:hypothetical protein